MQLKLSRDGHETSSNLPKAEKNRYDDPQIDDIKGEDALLYPFRQKGDSRCENRRPEVKSGSSYFRNIENQILNGKVDAKRPSLTNGKILPIDTNKMVMLPNKLSPVSQPMTQNGKKLCDFIDKRSSIETS